MAHTPWCNPALTRMAIGWTILYPIEALDVWVDASFESGRSCSERKISWFLYFFRCLSLLEPDGKMKTERKKQKTLPVWTAVGNFLIKALKWVIMLVNTSIKHGQTFKWGQSLYMQSLWAKCWCSRLQQQLVLPVYVLLLLALCDDIKKGYPSYCWLRGQKPHPYAV